MNWEQIVSVEQVGTNTAYATFRIMFFEPFEINAEKLKQIIINHLKTNPNETQSPPYSL